MYTNTDKSERLNENDIALLKKRLKGTKLFILLFVVAEIVIFFVVGFIFSWKIGSYFFLASVLGAVILEFIFKKARFQIQKDLIEMRKDVFEDSVLEKKIHQQEEGNASYSLILEKKGEIMVEDKIFQEIQEGDKVVVERTPNSKTILNVSKN